MITASVRATLDWLIASGRITGYTVEPPPVYLVSRHPTITYSMYAGDALSNSNLGSFCGDLALLRPQVTLRRIEGNVGGHAGTIERTDQIRVTARFRESAAMNHALELIRTHYLAGVGGEWKPGSWRYPDVRVTGVGRRPSGTLTAIAHARRIGPVSVVILSLADQPPLVGMRSHPVFLLDRWRRFFAEMAGYRMEIEAAS